MEKKISKYLNGTSNPEEFSQVLEALCREEPGELVDTALLKCWESQLSTPAETRENKGLLDRIHHRIALEEAKLIFPRIGLYKNLLRVAALIILGLTIASITFYRAGNQVESLATETVATPFGARTNLKLPDGSEVWLNSGSSITFPRQYGAIRRVELNGEAMFRVAKTGKSFVVETSSGKVEVMGTTFDVRAYSGENFETTLVEGSVKVSNLNNEELDLKPGQRSVVGRNEKIVVDQVDPALVVSWTQGKLVFIKEPLVDVASELERWYNVKIVLQGEKLKNLCYTGTIQMETFTEVLELINITTPIKYDYNKDTRVLRIAGR